MTSRRVVITGMGIVSPAGNSLDAFWNSLYEGRCGIGAIERFDASAYSTRIAAQVKGFNAEDYLPKREIRRMDLFVQYACAASLQAMEDAAYKISPETSGRTGVWVGTGIGGIETIEKQHNVLSAKGPGMVNPFMIPMILPNMAAGQVSILLGARGPCGCTVTACASGTNSVGEAFRFIQNNYADAMVAGGAEACIAPLAVAGFCAAKAMSTHNDDPAGACRPFDLNRSGFVMGEGAGMLVLEELEHALARGASIHAEIIGYGTSADAFHVVQPDAEGTGAVMAFERVLQDAGLEPGQVNYINAHGTGTSLNDALETRVIKTVFGDHARNLLVSSTKPATGHMLGAGGAAELIATVLAIKHQIVPMTINLETPDPECDLDYVPGSSRPWSIDAALSDSLGFGGHNAVLAVKKV